MFKKLKDKLAEEVKSSPQRIQQFAQAAQAAVTSASSSISDITNNDLFSIGDNDTQQPRPAKMQPSPSSRQNTFQDVSLVQPSGELLDNASGQEVIDNQRHRRLSNSSLASDISFRLPSYETPSMYHLQSDMEVSASEAEERGFSSGAVSLDRVTKEQLYAAYRRTQERYTKYRTQYGDLARHYKLLERENAKARSVLVETQDKALRRISELKEQCSLEQSAKAHLEKALRVEIEEKIMKIDALNTKIKVLQTNLDLNNDANRMENIQKEGTQKENDVQLINLTNDNETKAPSEDLSGTEISNLNNKIEKMEQLLNKYKESLKSSKEKNAQVTTELKILSNELENKNKEIEQFKQTTKQLDESIHKIRELTNVNEDLQNKINTYDFTKTKEMSELEMDLQRAKEEITQLQGKIEIFTKREEDYAISLAENKLSIHKELENKESEIKSLKDNLSTTQKEMQSLNIIINDYKTNILSLEEERSKLLNENKEFAIIKTKVGDLESQLQETTKKHQLLEQMKTKADEEYKCLQLQLKQETAEKLAMIDRNTYLENRNMQLSEENSKKSSQISSLENELQSHKNSNMNINIEDIENEKIEMRKELEVWKLKYDKLKSEIQEEREELVKLQSEIEKLLVNHELTQRQNKEFRETISDLKTANSTLQDQINNNKRLKENLKNVGTAVSELQNLVNFTSNDVVSIKQQFSGMFLELERDLNFTLSNFNDKELEFINKQLDALKIEYTTLQQKLKTTSDHNSDTSKIIISLQDENNNLKSIISQLESEKDSINESKTSIDKLYEAALNNIEVLKHEQKELVSKIQESANKSKNLEAALDSANVNSLSASEELSSLQHENKDLINNLKAATDKNKFLNDEIKNLKREKDINIEQLDILSKENNELREKSVELDAVLIQNNKLHENIKALSDENILLKEQIEKIDRNIKVLESEIVEVRKSHADMEIEKDHLNTIIEKLEAKEKTAVDLSAKAIQTDNIVEVNELSKKTTTSDLLSIKGEEIVSGRTITENEYILLQNDNDVLKDENRRLQSDVDGLQKYLTKISKENGVLNDKLRELIATSEHTPENSEVSKDVTELKNEIELSKEKIENLLRENNLLVEENLELKDQLQSHNYTGATDPNNINNTENGIELKEKYKILVQTNTKAEQKLRDVEQLNRSLNSNMQQIQDKNEKLKMTNEKLERKLDEALVSLRHLHSLQENTELEYLRNILYEYLTGSGIHSITLAKVLSAIVKFDDSQTQLVLQKEKERQGFLRQLGLL